MIPKSGTRFSDKIMRQKKRPNTAALRKINAAAEESPSVAINPTPAQPAADL